MDLKNKKILITGGHGFLGKHLVSNLLNKRKISANNIFAPTSRDFDFRRREDCLKVVAGQDVIIHLAGKVGGIGFNQEKPAELFYDNIVMGVQLMEAARDAGVEKFVSLGTICSYPKFTPVPFKEDDLWNGYPEETNAPYGIAKKMLLVQSQAYRIQYGFNAIFLLPVNMYGPGDSFDSERSHVIPALIRKVFEAKRNNQDHINAWGTGKATREFLYVEDSAEGIILATENYDKPEPVNLGSGMEISIKDLIGVISRFMDYKGQIIWDPTRPDGQPRRKLDTERAEIEFGFKAKVDFEEGLKKTIDWWVKEGKDIYYA